VAGIYRVYQVMVVTPVVPGQDRRGVHRLRQGQSGKINFGSAGTGSVAHVSGELFKMMAGVDMQHVPYRGAPLALADLLGGQVQVMFDNLPSSIEPHPQRPPAALGVSTPQRLELLPDVPTDRRLRGGLRDQRLRRPRRAGRHAARDRRQLNKAVGVALANRAQGKILELGGVPMPMTPAEFGRLLAEETEKWGKVIRAANIKPA
jgi:tripartite-type tricarboxylate transporter receptor subunit TctC